MASANPTNESNTADKSTFWLLSGDRKWIAIAIAICLLITAYMAAF